mmetsp:Transcript_44378/g.74690  ORF Transcript_44378/g.74690 Transcript_44378/m.74690 type:complete len:226 (-) Transcript_44378:784-1461(-)
MRLVEDGMWNALRTDHEEKMLREWHANRSFASCARSDSRGLICSGGGGGGFSTSSSSSPASSSSSSGLNREARPWDCVRAGWMCTQFSSFMRASSMYPSVHVLNFTASSSSGSGASVAWISGISSGAATVYGFGFLGPPSSSSSSSSGGSVREKIKRGAITVPCVMRAIWARKKCFSTPGNGGCAVTGASRSPVKNLQILRAAKIHSGRTSGNSAHTVRSTLVAT